MNQQGEHIEEEIDPEYEAQCVEEYPTEAEEQHYPPSDEEENYLCADCCRFSGPRSYVRIDDDDQLRCPVCGSDNLVEK